MFIWDFVLGTVMDQIIEAWEMRLDEANLFKVGIGVPPAPTQVSPKPVREDVGKHFV